MHTHWLQAFWYGVLSAASLPLGAVMGVCLRPPDRVVAALMAMGSGALLAALTLELVGPAMADAGFAPMAVGVTLGCGSFVALNAVLNNRGAFLRKAATLAQVSRRDKRRKIESLVSQLSRVDILRALPPEEIQAIVPYIEERHFSAGTTILHQGDVGTSLFIIESGSVAVIRREDDQQIRLATLAAGQTFGEMALLSGETRNADVIALEPVRTWEVEKQDFDLILRASPALRQAVTSLVEERKSKQTPMGPSEWGARVMKHLDPNVLKPTQLEMQQIAQVHKGASVGLAIWLGACLDGIGEALVIGATTIGASVSLPLIGGVLLSNLPESMSSSAAMHRQGTGLAKILWMWLSLTLVTGAAAAVGNVLFAHSSPAVFAFFEGAAAGGMLVMIAQTMLPEAFEQGGGTAVGVLTVAGFLAALFVRSLSSPH